MKNTTRFPAQSLVEFALIIPLLLLLLLGFFDLGRAIINLSALSNAVREGTRAGIVMAYDEDAIKDIVLDYAFTTTLTRDNIGVVPTADNFGTLKTLQITANYCFVPVTPGVAAIVGNNCTGGDSGIPLTTNSIMRYEPSN